MNPASDQVACDGSNINPVAYNLLNAKLPDGILNLAVASGLAASNSEARKLITNNGLKLNDMAVSDPRLIVDVSALNPDGVLKLSSGKKKHVLVKPL